MPHLIPWRARGPWVDVNDRRWRQAEIPAVNGHATARGLAGFWQAYLDPATAGRGWGNQASPVTTALSARTSHGRSAAHAWTGQTSEWVASEGNGRRRAPSNLAWAFLTTYPGDHRRSQLVEDAIVASLPGSHPTTHTSP